LNTGKASSKSNSYLEEFLTLNPMPHYYTLHLGRDIRTELVQKYSWAIPNNEAIQFLAKLFLVEIGAGRGYWAHLINEVGGDIVAYDKYVKKGKVKVFQALDWVETYYPIAKGSYEAGELHSDRTLFLCWPPYNTSMAYDCLNTYLKSGGKQIVYIGEGDGGCTADDDFHNLLLDQMTLEKEIKIPQWRGVWDTLEFWVKKC